MASSPAIAAGLLLFSFALLWTGGGIATRNALAVAGKLGMSPFVISVLLLGFGTSLPELATVVEAALVGEARMALANVVGSNIANMLLILPLAAVFYPVTIGGRVLSGVDVVASIAAVATLALAIYLFGGISRLMGVVAIGLIIAYALLIRHDGNADEKPAASRSLMAHLLGLGLGLAAVILGAELAVGNGIKLAVFLGISTEVMGLVAIAIGTSLPELAVVVAAARLKRSAVVLGNLVGSNIFNLWAILGAAALARPLEGVSADLKTVDLPLMAAATALFLLLACYAKRLSRTLAVSLLMVYALWAIYRLG